jgi:hypothetical protein
LLDHNAVVNLRQLLRRGNRLRRLLRLPVLLALQLLGKVLDLQLLCSERVFQGLDIGGRDGWKRRRSGGLIGSRLP